MCGRERLQARARAYRAGPAQRRATAAQQAAERRVATSRCAARGVRGRGMDAHAGHQVIDIASHTKHKVPVARLLTCCSDEPRQGPRCSERVKGGGAASAERRREASSSTDGRCCSPRRTEGELRGASGPCGDAACKGLYYHRRALLLIRGRRGSRRVLNGGDRNGRGGRSLGLRGCGCRSLEVGSRKGRRWGGRRGYHNRACLHLRQ
jgi:hypothetical protein